MRLTVSAYSFCERRCAPDITVSFSSSDFFAAAMKRLATRLATRYANRSTAVFAPSESVVGMLRRPK
jgi:hypothetical protein